ncbi:MULTISPECIES: Rpn family recombination-promoting nuclease/putative transposase [Gordonia]
MSVRPRMVGPMADGGSGERAHQPHDGLFRRVFGDPKHAGSELRSVLSAEVAAHIDLDHLEPVAASFVDDNLRQVHSDLLFRTTLDGDDAYRRHGLVVCGTR